MDKQKILDEFYSNFYQKLFYSGISKLGTNLIHNNLQKTWDFKNHLRTLEVGAGLGEHYNYLLKRNLKIGNYYSVDINHNLNFRRMQEKKNNIWVNADITKLPFKNDLFQRIISTCLFHHLDDPMTAYQEIRRVASNGCEIKIAYPTDPGIVNRLIKKIYTDKRAIKIGLSNIELIHALEHKNSINNILIYQKYAFKNDCVVNKYIPLKIKSWNLNLLIVSHIKINK